MAMDISRHPCFNPHMRRRYGRIHLPVAPKCNVQCGFCNRKYDCVNESRPGVTSAVLTPHQALEYLRLVLVSHPETSVVGIAGPGDPFACPDETMETLRLVREHYPEMILCVASNGLNVAPYAEELAALEVSHVTITVNAIDPTIGERVYRWIRNGTQVMRGTSAGALLVERQYEAIDKLKALGMTVKVNSILLPTINEDHIEDIAKEMAKRGVDIFNCIPMLPADGADFENLGEPDADLVASVRGAAEKYLPQMRHCSRCRADAVGILGKEMSEDVSRLLQGCCNQTKTDRRETAKRVAVATMEGVLVNQHLGDAFELSVFENSATGPSFVEKRKTPSAGSGKERWKTLAETLEDCHTILVQFAGESPKKALGEFGIEVINMDGLIDGALREVFAGRPVPSYMTTKAPIKCGAGSGCGGNGNGCGA